MALQGWQLRDLQAFRDQGKAVLNLVDAEAAKNARKKGGRGSTHTHRRAGAPRSFKKTSLPSFTRGKAAVLIPRAMVNQAWLKSKYGVPYNSRVYIAGNVPSDDDGDGVGYGSGGSGGDDDDGEEGGGSDDDGEAGGGYDEGGRAGSGNDDAGFRSDADAELEDKQQNGGQREASGELEYAGSQ